MSAHCEPGSQGASGATRNDQHDAAGRADEHNERPLIALIGRPNAGKSSLFNRLTGGDAHVGNYPGVTVDILEGTLDLGVGEPVTVADLPGLYSLESAIDAATDEGVAREFLARAARSHRRVVLVQVIDATRLALGLRLTRELRAQAFPLLVVATQRDVLAAEGREIDLDALADALGVPVLAVNARAAQSRAQVAAALADVVAGGDRGRGAGAPPNWDPDALARRVVRERADASAEMARRRSRTARADAVLLHPLLGPVLFLAIMAALFAAVFLVADPVTTVLDAAIQAIAGRVQHALGDGLLASFVTDGLLGGAGTVLAFLPQIVILTVAMELLEASGYMARGAFLVDRALRASGLGGRAFVPLLTAHACAVPAIAATRSMRDPRERLTALLVLPLMTCSARIPTYGLLIATFFAGRGAWVQSLIFVALYFAGVASGMLAALVLGRTVTRGRRLPLVLEMPAYRRPEARQVARVALRASRQFLREVGTTIVVVAAVLWGLLTVPVPGATVVDPSLRSAPARVVRMHRSVAASVGRALEPVTRPLGFDWRINVGLIGSFGARELMVGTLGVIFGIEDAGDDPAPLAARIRTSRGPDGRPAYSPRMALALLAFFVLACQCMSTLAALRRETRSWRWPAFVLVYTYGAAYAAAWTVYRLAGLAGLA